MSETLKEKELDLRALLENKQYSILRESLSDMNTVDIASLMDDMENEESLKMFRILPKDIAALSLKTSNI